MNRKTSIEWTDTSWNPARGCSRVSQGCANCYAEREALRWSNPGQPFHGFVDQQRGAWTGKVQVRAEWLAKGLGLAGRVFVNSMSDLFHEALGDHAIAAVYGVMLAQPDVTWQVVTKRPSRAYEFLRAHSASDCIDAARVELERVHAKLPPARVHSWPPANVHLLTSVEDRASAADRIPPLLGTQAPVLGLSCEPLLEELDLAPWIHSLHWVIAGGESGAGARPMHPAWARSLRDQCVRAGVPFFFKQWGAWCPVSVQTHDAIRVIDLAHGQAFVAPYQPRRELVGRLLDGRTWDEFPREPRR